MAVSGLTVACSDKEKAAETVEHDNASQLGAGQLTEGQKTELKKRQERAAQKGNGLDSFNPDDPKGKGSQRKSNNGLDTFKPN